MSDWVMTIGMELYVIWFENVNVVLSTYEILVTHERTLLHLLIDSINYTSKYLIRKYT